MQENFGVLVLGHGSKLTYNKRTVETVAAMLAERMTEATIKTAYLNMDRPTVEEGIESFAETDVTTLYVLPLFLAHGTHTLKDIPEILGLSDGQRRTTHSFADRSVDVVYAEPLGIDPCRYSSFSTPRPIFCLIDSGFCGSGKVAYLKPNLAD